MSFDRHLMFDISRLINPHYVVENDLLILPPEGFKVRFYDL